MDGLVLRQESVVRARVKVCRKRRVMGPGLVVDRQHGVVGAGFQVG